MAFTDHKDNSTISQKAALRVELRKLLPPALAILETHGGSGKLFKRVYDDVTVGLVLDSDAMKAELLARQRPTWRVYEAKAEKAIAAGLGADFACNLVDVDPYGEPWPTLEAYFTSERQRPAVIGFAVNDGLRQKLKVQAGWQVRSMRQPIEHFGNTQLHSNYLDVCRWKFERFAELIGYNITHWAGYYCGKSDDNTHYAAVLETRSKTKASPVAT